MPWQKVVNVSVMMVLPGGALLPASAQGSDEGQLRRISYVSHLDRTARDFFLYLPRGYGRDGSRKWPVILFLHGDGERGNGKDHLGYVLKNGPLYEAWIQKRDLPEIPRRLAEGVPTHNADVAKQTPRECEHARVGVLRRQGRCRGDRLIAMGATNVRFTTHQDMWHDVWNRVYAGGDLYDWLLESRRQ